MPHRILFTKTGKEIKAAVQKRKQQLQSRLDKRNEALNEFLKVSQKVRSYMVRSSQPIYGHGTRGYTLYSKDDISSEEIQEVNQLCLRIYEIEQELHRLSLISMHMSDETVYELEFNDLIGYGFDDTLDGGIDA